MIRYRRYLLLLICGLALGLGLSAGWVAWAAEDDDTPDVVFVPTAHDVVSKMLETAGVKKGDVVYDLGCGDGRIVATAAKKFGCKGIGFDINPIRVKESLQTVDQYNVAHLVEIQRKNIFNVDLSQASVITLYLLPSLNNKLVPQLSKMKPGSRIVSHEYDGMEGIKYDKKVTMTSREDNTEHVIYLWTIPFKKDEPEKEEKE
jgi:SAM-dependent methyltransferase